MIALALPIFASSLIAQITQPPPIAEQLPGPSNSTAVEATCCATGPELPPSKDTFEDWLADIKNYRHERLIRMGYSGEQYDRPELKWTQKALIQTLLITQDRYFYDPVNGKYTVDRYLDDLEARYGGIDAVLIWQIYPNFGMDDRNQYDMLRDMPGGIAGVRQMVSDFHRRGVRVLFPVVIEDQGTRDEGVSDAEAGARLLAELDADGVNLDSQVGVPLNFRQASDATGHPLVFQPENGIDYPGESLARTNMTWGYWEYPFIPMVSMYKWLEPRHMVNVCDRWAEDKTNDLQYAFFNGVGYESWENVWGIWNQMDDRDAEALRRVATIERAYSSVLLSPQWEPHTPMLEYGVFASRFPAGNQTLWTVVNRNAYDVAGRQIEVPYRQGVRYFDLWHGVELTPKPQPTLAVDVEKTAGPTHEQAGESAPRTVVLSFDMEAHGFGAILETTEVSDPLRTLLTSMHRLAERPLASYSHEWHFLSQHIVENPPTDKVRHGDPAPEGMVLIPGGDFDLRVSGLEIEGASMPGVDVQMPWEDSPRRVHSHQMQIDPFYMDRYPVTNGQFKAFLDSTHYRPKDDHNFLRDWRGGTYPDGWANKPVTWVAIEDARAYASWAGKRLPHEWEWQYAAQGTDERLYPWGNGWIPADVPVPDRGRMLRAADDVNAHPDGASPFGVQDLVGNVWQWTDEYQDLHTRAAIVRGGSYYQPQTTPWYFPQAYRLDEHGKYLLMSPGFDRSGTIGFRCVKDAE